MTPEKHCQERFRASQLWAGGAVKIRRWQGQTGSREIGILRKRCREKLTNVKEKGFQEMTQWTDVTARLEALPSLFRLPPLWLPSPGLPGLYWYFNRFICIALVMCMCMNSLVYLRVQLYMHIYLCVWNHVCRGRTRPHRLVRPLLQVLWLTCCSSCFFGLWLCVALRLQRAGVLNVS
jgi:hypothetical protein